MNKVVLNKEEARWFSRNVIKTKTLLESAAQKDPGILDRATYKLVCSIQPQAKEIESVIEQLGEEPYELELSLTKKQKKLIVDMVEKTIAMLTERIIPVYNERGLSEYAEDANRKVELLKNMKKRFK